MGSLAGGGPGLWCPCRHHDRLLFRGKSAPSGTHGGHQGWPCGPAGLGPRCVVLCLAPCLLSSKVGTLARAEAWGPRLSLCLPQPSGPLRSLLLSFLSFRSFSFPFFLLAPPSPPPLSSGHTCHSAPRAASGPREVWPGAGRPGGGGKARRGDARPGNGALLCSRLGRALAEAPCDGWV